LGITDSVKYIQIDLNDNDAITLILSKNYGFIRCLDFRNFNPGIYYFSEELSYSTFLLSGISGSGLGNDLITRGQIYDFNISDEFHSNIYFDDEYGNLQAIEYCVKIILEKYFSTNGDTVLYSIDDTYWFLSSSGTSLYHDTIISKYSDLDQVIPDQDRLPFENIYYFPDEIGYYGMYSGYSGRQYVYDRTENYFADLEDSCFHDMIYLKNSLSPSLDHSQFIEGCGSYHWLIDPEWWSCVYCESMQYYKKGGQEWGNPLTIPVETEELKSIQKQLVIYPSPASEYIYIKVTSHNTNNPNQINIYSSQGKLVFQKLSDENSTTINTSDFPEGLYLVIIRQKAGEELTGKFIIAR
jgi:hypothetical protein